MKNLLLILMLSALLVACGGPLDKKYNPDTFDDDMQSMVDDNLLDYGQAMSIAMYVGAKEMLGEDVSGMTYAEILEKGEKMGDNLMEDTPNLQVD